MPRALSVSRVSVTSEKEAEYLETIRQLAVLADRRGQRLWVFRSADKPHAFVEFSESPSAMSHRARASRTPEELKLEMRLQTLATYAPDAWELWEEIPQESRHSSGGWSPEADEDG